MNLINAREIAKYVLPKSSPDHLSNRKPQYWQRYEGQTDKFDYDLEVTAMYEAAFRFFFDKYFRIQLRGVNNIPAEGAVILAGNHSGTIPLDGLMTVQATFEHHTPRRLRYLVLPWFRRVAPVWHCFSKIGCVEASVANAMTLINDGELVGIYPEGQRAMTKSWSERYQMRQFDPAFVKLAIATQTPIVPVITIGAEEAYPNFGNLDRVAKFMDMPIYPITLTFPWLPFPFAYTPVPTRWLIQFGKPITLNYSPDQSLDRRLVKKVTAEIQHHIQQELNTMRAKRKSIFTGWSERDLDAYELQSAKKDLDRVFDLSVKQATSNP